MLWACRWAGWWRGPRRRAWGGAESLEAGRRLKIVRLFTLGTPHGGAKLAEVARPDAAARDMRAGSAFLTALDRSLAGASYELVCYTRLRDTWVGQPGTVRRAGRCTG